MKVRFLSMIMKSVGFGLIIIRMLITSRDWIIFAGALLMLAGWYTLDFHHFCQETIITRDHSIPHVWKRWSVHD
jgi:hypothetical protein